MDTGYLYAAVYIFFRLAPITLVAPILIFSYIPLLVRTLITLVWAVILASSLSLQELNVIPQGIHPSYLVCEFVLGIVLSLGFHAANAAIHMVSQLIDIQIGISAGATFDPVNFQTTSPLGTLFGLLAVATFFLTNLHYEFLYFFGELFRAAPPGHLYYVDQEFYQAMTGIFALAFVMASPVIITLWLIDVGLSFTSRSMPQAQIYFVAMPLKIMFGLFVLSLALPLANQTFYQIYTQVFHSWDLIQKY